MRRLLPLLLLASCASPSVSPDVPSIVPLIKAERYDEAAAVDQNLLAPAFVRAVQEMSREGADAGRIVAVSKRFFDGYPFCPKDLEINESVFRTVADAHFEAQCRLIPPTPQCAAVETCRTFADFASVLNSGDRPHNDGGRCARKVLAACDRAFKRGPEWISNPYVVGKLQEPDEDLLDACGPPFEHQPELLLLAFSVARLRGLLGDSPWTSWRQSFRIPESSEWSFPARCRDVWLLARRFEADSEDIVRFHEDLLKSGRSGLRDLGAVFEAWNVAAGEFRSDSIPDLPMYRRVFSLIDRTAAGTPFPDAARRSLIVQYVHLDRLDEAETWIRDLRPQFSHPSIPSMALLYVLDRRYDASEDLEDAPALVSRVREALAWDSQGPSALLAHETLSRIHLKLGRDPEALESLIAALRIPDDSRVLESNAMPYSRSRAEMNLARQYEKQGRWELALKAWETWNSHHGGCGLHAESNHGIQSAGIARCLDALGRPAEAATHYWEAITSADSSDMASARRLLEIHGSLETVAELKSGLEKHLQGLERIPDHLRWLAGQLGVAVR